MPDEVCAQEDSFGSSEKEDGLAPPGPSQSSSSSGIKNVQKMRVEAVLTNVVKEVVEAQREE